MKASLSYARISPSKLKLVADLIRGKELAQANNILKFCPKRGAYFLLKLLNSAVANATLNPEINTERLYIQQILVNSGVILKRWRAAPRGRTAPIKKRTSHATIILGERSLKKAMPKLKPKTKSTKTAAPAASTETPKGNESETPSDSTETKKEE